MRTDKLARKLTRVVSEDGSIDYIRCDETVTEEELAKVLADSGWND